MGIARLGRRVTAFGAIVAVATVLVAGGTASAQISGASANATGTTCSGGGSVARLHHEQQRQDARV